MLARQEPGPPSLEESVEAEVWSGAGAELVGSQRLRLQYRCQFHLTNYPFDTQFCSFILMMEVKGNKSVEGSPAILT